MLFAGIEHGLLPSEGYGNTLVKPASASCKVRLSHCSQMAAGQLSDSTCVSHVSVVCRISVSVWAHVWTLSMPAEAKHELKVQHSLVLKAVTVQALGGLSVMLMSRDLKQVPDDVLHKTTVRRLSLARNQLTTLPAALAQLQQLRSLDIGSNKLQAHPDVVVALTKLTRLCLQDNCIQSVPATLARLTALQVC